MYHPFLLDHYRNPRNRGTLERPDFSSGRYNPSCGDGIELAGIIKNGRLEVVKFTGQGCMISQAAASLLTEMVTGMPLEKIRALTADDMKKMVGIELGPTRLKCAMLGLMALQEGLHNLGTRKREQRA